MAEPATKTPTVHREHRAPADEPGITLLRWVERPDGQMEQVELPLTPELFLNPQVGDQIMQGERHGDTVTDLYRLLKSHFRREPEVLVLFDVKHLFGPELPGPGPDVSIIRGSKKGDRFSFDVEAEGALPCLIIEVVSPFDSKIRRTDLEDKVEVYRRAGIPEYVIVDSTQKDRRYRLLGYRLDRAGRYRPIEPDAEGRILSETTGLWFQISRDGERVLVFEHPSGRRLLNLEETQDLRQTAEERAERETQALEAAEAEIARLKAELDRLRGDNK
jgi:Uma2 family endonuclease